MTSTGAGEIVVQAWTPGSIRVRLFGSPVVPDASYVVGETGPLPPVRSPAPWGRGGRDITVAATANGARVEVEGGGDGPVRLSFFDGDGRRLLGTPPAGGITREAVVTGASGRRGQCTGPN